MIYLSERLIVSDAPISILPGFWASMTTLGAGGRVATGTEVVSVVGALGIAVGGGAVAGGRKESRELLALETRRPIGEPK